MQNALSIVLDQPQSSQLRCFRRCYTAILELDVYSCNNYSRTKIIRLDVSFHQLFISIVSTPGIDLYSRGNDLLQYARKFIPPRVM
jgi:hypothetical protein